MDQEGHIERIEAFLEGKMSEEERKAFEEELLSEPELKEAYERYLGVMDLLKESASLRLKEKMQKLEREQNDTIKHVNWRPFWGIAASLLVLVAAYLWMSDSGKLGSEELLTEHFSLYPSGTLRGEVRADDLFAQGMEYYQVADYSAAIAALEGVAEEDNRFIESRLYLGNCYIHQKKYQNAIEMLNLVCDKGGVRFSESGCWYLLLAYVGSGQIEPFQNLSAKILEEPQNSYQQKVRELQKKWKNL